jgi:hypothetical protein
MIVKVPSVKGIVKDLVLSIVLWCIGVKFGRRPILSRDAETHPYLPVEFYNQILTESTYHYPYYCSKLIHIDRAAHYFMLLLDLGSALRFL